MGGGGRIRARLGVAAVVVAVAWLGIRMLDRGEPAPSRREAADRAVAHARAAWPAGFAPGGEGERDSAAAERRSTITGRVVDGVTGSPIPGAVLVAGSARGGDGDAPLLELTTGEDGRFALDPPAGTTTLTVSADGFATLHRFLAFTPGTQELTLALDGAVRLRGTVVDRRGAPIAGASLVATDEESGGRLESKVAHSAADGAFEIADAPPGRLVVRAHHATHAGAELEIGGLGPGRERDGISLVLPDAGVVAGRVVDSTGGAVAGAVVRRVGGGSRSEDRTVEAVTDAAGRYRLDAIPPGRQTLVATGEAGTGGVEVEIPEGGEAVVDIRVESTWTARGRVTDAAGAPVVGARVSTVPPQIAWRDRRSMMRFAAQRDLWVRGASTDDEGQFELPGMLDSPAPIEVVTSFGQAKGEASRERPEVELVLPDGTTSGTIEGRVTRSDGSAFDGAATALLFAGGDPEVDRGWRVRRGRSVRNEVVGGTFRFEGLAPGRWSVQLRAPGYADVAPVEVEVSAGARESVEFLLPMQGSLRGSLHDERGRPVRGARVSAMRSNGGREEGGRLDWSQASFSDPVGRFVVETGEGEVSLFVYHPEFRSEVVRGRVAAGRVTDVGVVTLESGEGRSSIFEFAGIGAAIGDEEGRYVVQRVFPRTPAERAGLRDRDRLVEVDGVPTEGLSLEDLISRIRGPEGTTVSLLLSRDGNPEAFRLDVTRERIRS